MILRARTPRELERKRNLLKKVNGVMTFFAILTIVGWLGILGYSIYAQFWYDPYSKSKVPVPLPRSWAGGVFKIEVSEGGNVSYGTGFSIGPQLVITNGHVVKKQKIYVKLYTDQGKEIITGYVLWIGNYKRNVLEDIAIISIAKKRIRNQKQIFPLYRGDEIKKLDRLIALGFNSGHKNLSYVPGQVTSLTRQDRLIQHNAQINMGFSGSPLIATKNKQVIGIVVAEEDKTVGKQRLITGIKLAIPIKEVLGNIPANYGPHIGIMR